MWRSIRLFFTNKDANPYLVVACLLLASLAETIGIGTLLPVISIAAGGSSGVGSALGKTVSEFLAWLGLGTSLGTLVIIVAVFMVLKGILSFSAISYATYAAARVATALRKRLATAIFDARWSYFSDQKSGRLANIMGGEASLAAESYVNSANVVASAIQAIAYTAIAFAISPQLAVMGIGTGIFLTFTLQRFVTAARKASYKQTDRTNTLLNDMVDALANIKPLKSMHRHEPMLASITRVFGKLRQTFVARELAKAGLAHSGDAIIAVIAAIGIFVASTYLKVPFPELVVSAIVFNQIVYVSARLQRMVQMAGRFESSYVRTTEAIAEAETARESNTGRVMPDIGGSCRFENVGFLHGGSPILSGVSLEIPANAITVLSGPSGAGKTTIIDLLIGLHRPASGGIFIGETPIAEVDIAAWRRQIGYVPQELSLFHASIRFNLTLGDESIGDAAIIDALRQAGAAEFVSQLPAGLDTDVGEMGSKLSGGQRQRISLARALVNGPKVLILDEVTSALDPETEAGIVKNIAGLRGQFTLLAITHRPAWTKIADRLYYVSDGNAVMAPSDNAVTDSHPPIDN